jgi:beta-mannosidase
MWVRKVASDFGWDWVRCTPLDIKISSNLTNTQGPAFVPSGIYKPAYLVTLSQSVSNPSMQMGTPPVSPSESSTNSDPVFVDEASIDIYKVGQSFSVPPVQTAHWAVNVSLALRIAGTVPASVLTLSIPELKITSGPFRIANIPASTNSSSWISAIWEIPDAIPQRWYPHNLGTPKLYNVTVSLDILASGDLKPGTNLVKFVTTTGFRTIQLIQTPYDRKDVEQRGITPGDQWHFEINGKAFYSLGTNIIPFDPFYARTTTDQVRWVLESAVKGGQNMASLSFSNRISHSVLISCPS